MDQATSPVDQIINTPWYQSTQGPRISTTVKAIAGLVIPLLITSGVLKTGLPWLDSAIDAACLLGFGGYALYGYIKAKKALGAQIKYLQGVIKQG